MNGKLLGAKSLFHLTSRTALEGILKSRGFKPGSCHEPIAIAESLTVAIPLVCFCDIRLTQIDAHAKDYGEYGIGMTKEWGLRNGINPVMYLSKESLALRTLSDTFRAILLDSIEDPETKLRSLRIHSDHHRTVVKNFINLLTFLKAGIGPKWSKETRTFDQAHTKEYYEEREWRHVHFESETSEPNMMRLPFFPLFMEQRLNTGITNDILAERAPLLSFVGDDIRYIIASDRYGVEALAESSLWEGLFINRDDFLMRIVGLDRVSEDF